jgi:hypothetical protein
MQSTQLIDSVSCFQSPVNFIGRPTIFPDNTFRKAKLECQKVAPDGISTFMYKESCVFVCEDFPKENQMLANEQQTLV